MDLDEKIKEIRKKIDFDNTVITEEGYGTFIPKKKTKIEIAYEMKKRADILIRTNRKEGNKMYLESIFLYIKGYREDERSSDKIKIIAWQSLCKFIDGIISQLIETELGVRNIFEYIKFNIKMHYLHYEAIHSIKHKNFSEVVLNQYINLKNIYDNSKIENFCITKLDNLEEMTSKLMLNL